MGRYNLRLITMMVVRLPKDSELYKKVESLYPRGEFENSVEYKERMSNEMLAHLAEGCYDLPEGWWGNTASKLLLTFHGLAPKSVLKEVEHTFTPNSENSE